LFDLVMPVLFYSDYTKKTLKCIENTDMPYRLIIIYNGDNCKHGEELSEIAHIYHNFDENQGISKSWNWGAQQSKNNDLIFLNDDLLLPKFWLEAFQEGLKNEWMVCPQYTRINDNKWKGKHDEVDKVLVKAIIGPPPGFAGFCWGLKREAYEKIGPFDEQFFYWFTDTDYFIRCSRAGHTPKQLQGFWIHHYESRTMNKIHKQGKLKKIREERAAFKRKYGKNL